MPITLGCPSCGKRFRARDESAGKRVKCPFCQSAVAVPSAAESEAAGAPTDEVPISPSSPSGSSAHPAPREPAPAQHRPASPPPPVPVSAASTAEWGIGLPLLPPAPEVPPPAFSVLHAPMLPERTAPPKAAKPAAEKTPTEHLVAAWKKTRGGLGWVLFGLFWFALIGFVPFGKLVYERSVGPLPDGEGWVKIDGYLNQGQDAIVLTKREELNVLLYGVPILLGGLAVVLGRLTAGAAPRNSGAKGLFAFSGLFALLALAGFATWEVCERVAFREVAGYGWWAAVIGTGVSEFWFLLALGASGATLRRPKAVRAVGAFALVVGLGVVLYFVGWDVYVDKVGPQVGRPKTVAAGSDWQLYEEAAKMLGWLVVVGTYWRAVRGVRVAIREFIRDET
jgi:hypothetical protein